MEPVSTVFGHQLAAHQLRWLEAMESTPPGGRLVILGPRCHGLSTTAFEFTRRLALRRPEARILFVVPWRVSVEKRVAMLMKAVPTAHVSPYWTQDTMRDPPEIGDGAEFDVVVFDGNSVPDPESANAAYRAIDLVSKDGIVVAIGTPKARRDVLNHFLTDGRFRAIHSPAVSKFPESCVAQYENGEIVGFEVKGNAEVLWPEMWPFARPALEGRSLMTYRTMAERLGMPVSFTAMGQDAVYVFGVDEE